jgi:hypothetical protein
MSNIFSRSHRKIISRADSKLGSFSLQKSLKVMFEPNMRCTTDGIPIGPISSRPGMSPSVSFGLLRSLSVSSGLLRSPSLSFGLFRSLVPVTGYPHWSYLLSSWYVSLGLLGSLSLFRTLRSPSASFRILLVSSSPSASFALALPLSHPLFSRLSSPFHSVSPYLAPSSLVLPSPRCLPRPPFVSSHPLLNYPLPLPLTKISRRQKIGVGNLFVPGRNLFFGSGVHEASKIFAFVVCLERY